MRSRTILPAIALLGLLSGGSRSGKSGNDTAKKYTNPDENKQGAGQAGGGAQGDAMTGGGKADNNSGGPAANMSNSSNSDDSVTTKHEPGVSANDQPKQQNGAGNPPPKR